MQSFSGKVTKLASAGASDSEEEEEQPKQTLFSYKSKKMAVRKTLYIHLIVVDHDFFFGLVGKRGSFRPGGHGHTSNRDRAQPRC